MNTPIEEYEVHPFYPTRFLRWAIKSADYLPSPRFDGLEKVSCEKKILQQKWRNISGDEQWRDIPEVLIEPNVTVEEVPLTAKELLHELTISDLPPRNL